MQPAATAEQAAEEEREARAEMRRLSPDAFFLPQTPYMLQASQGSNPRPHGWHRSCSAICSGILSAESVIATRRLGTMREQIGYPHL
eukprot:2095472-Prymnesium_polylepis.1